MSTQKERNAAKKAAKKEALESNVAPFAINITLDDGYVNGEEGFMITEGITAGKPSRIGLPESKLEE